MIMVRAVSAGMTQGVSVPTGVTNEAQGQPTRNTNYGVGEGSKKPKSGLLHNPSGRRAPAAVPLLSPVEKRGVAARLPNFTEVLSEYRGHLFSNKGPRCLVCGTTYSQVVVRGYECEGEE